MTKEFIGYTVGLMATNDTTSKLVQVEYSRNIDKSVSLKVVSARNLAATKGSTSVTEQEFADRPQDVYDNVAEARWALKLCNWSVDSGRE